MRAEYDFSAGVRGTISIWDDLVLLKPDVAEAFPDAKSVNEGLRGLLASVIG